MLKVLSLDTYGQSWPETYPVPQFACPAEKCNNY